MDLLKKLETLGNREDSMGLKRQVVCVSFFNVQVKPPSTALDGGAPFSFLVLG
jgi:hypothetical protein